MRQSLLRTFHQERDQALKLYHHRATKKAALKNKTVKIKKSSSKDDVLSPATSSTSLESSPVRSVQRSAKINSKNKVLVSKKNKIPESDELSNQANSKVSNSADNTGSKNASQNNHRLASGLTERLPSSQLGENVDLFDSCSTIETEDENETIPKNYRKTVNIVDGVETWYENHETSIFRGLVHKITGNKNTGNKNTGNKNTGNKNTGHKKTIQKKSVENTFSLPTFLRECTNEESSFSSNRGHRKPVIQSQSEITIELSTNPSSQ